MQSELTALQGTILDLTNLKLNEDYFQLTFVVKLKQGGVVRTLSLPQNFIKRFSPWKFQELDSTTKPFCN